MNFRKNFNSSNTNDKNRENLTKKIVKMKKYFQINRVAEIFQRKINYSLKIKYFVLKENRLPRFKIRIGKFFIEGRISQTARFRFRSAQKIF